MKVLGGTRGAKPAVGVDTVGAAEVGGDLVQPWRELGLKEEEYDNIREILGRRPTSASSAGQCRVAVAATAGAMLSMATKDRIAALGLPPVPERWIGFLLGGRDGRLLIVAIGALLGRPAATLVLLIVTSALSLGARPCCCAVRSAWCLARAPVSRSPWWRLRAPLGRRDGCSSAARRSSPDCW